MHTTNMNNINSIELLLLASNSHSMINSDFCKYFSVYIGITLAASKTHFIALIHFTEKFGIQK